MGERLERLESELEKFKEREVKFETGVTTYFHRGVKAGLIYPVSGGIEIPFYLSGYRQFRPGIAVPQSVQKSETRPLTWDKMPATGTKVVFKRKGKGLGIKASLWGFKDEFDNMARQMETLPLYRIRSLTGEQTVWVRDETDPVISHRGGGVLERYENGKWEQVIGIKSRKK